MVFRIRFLAVFVFAGLLAACSTSSMRAVHRAPEFRSAEIHKVLVIGNFQNQDLRKAFEEEFVRQWERRGVHAISSLDVLPTAVPLSKLEVVPIAKAQGFDTVLVSHLLKVEVIEPGDSADPVIHPPPSPEDTQSVNGIKEILFSDPVYTNPEELVLVKTDVYALATEQRIWSGKSQTVLTGKFRRRISSFVTLILNFLYQ